MVVQSTYDMHYMYVKDLFSSVKIFIILVRFNLVRWNLLPQTVPVLRTKDTDVVVLAVACAQYINVSEMWIAFGVGKNYRNIPVHIIASRVGPEKASALPFFHAFTGCDTTSAFAGRGKKQHGIFGEIIQRSLMHSFPSLSVPIRYPTVSLKS